MRPIEHLPMPFPADFDPGPAFFSENFVKPFVPDMIQMMSTGIKIDQAAVEDLRVTVTEVLASVEKRLADSPVIAKYQESCLPAAQKRHYEESTQSIRTVKDYIKVFKSTDIVHRTWVVNTHLIRRGKPNDQREKWTIAEVKKYNIFLKSPLLQGIIDKKPLSQNSSVVEGMKALAEYKLELWNRPRYEKANTPVTLSPFNPGSHKQVAGLFKMLEIEPLEFSDKTGEASWPRKAVEKIQKQTEDPDLLVVLGAMIDHSYSAIIQSNFLKAFDTFTIDGVLYGNVKLFGAKSFRLTSNSPNMLNAPSTGSIYAKPLKRCFVAPEGYVIYTADLSALEDRVIANLSDDTSKKNVFLEGLDGHSLNACGYFPDKVSEIIGEADNAVQQVKNFMAEVDKENPLVIAIRQASKGPTFKLAYGGFPDAHKGGVITQEIFDNYHNVLYPGITDYRENYVLTTAEEQGYIHLGLGCRIYTDNPSNDIRTLHNATVQFWSILTLIAINEMNHRIREAGFEEHIQIQSSIYDSIYVQVVKDPEIIKWLDDNMIEVMTTQYLEHEVIHNEASGEIGPNWAELHKIPNNSSVEKITEVLGEF